MEIAAADAHDAVCAEAIFNSCSEETVAADAHDAARGGGQCEESVAAADNDAVSAEILMCTLLQLMLLTLPVPGLVRGARRG